MREITFNGYHLPTLAKLARELGSPVSSELAYFIWQLSNNQSLPLLIAEEFMLAAGYQPFLGYPLTRESEVKRWATRATSSTLEARKGGDS